MRRGESLEPACDRVRAALRQRAPDVGEPSPHPLGPLRCARELLLDERDERVGAVLGEAEPHHLRPRHALETFDHASGRTRRQHEGGLLDAIAAQERIHEAVGDLGTIATHHPAQEDAQGRRIQLVQHLIGDLRGVTTQETRRASSQAQRGIPQRSPHRGLVAAQLRQPQSQSTMARAAGGEGVGQRLASGFVQRASPRQELAMTLVIVEEIETCEPAFRHAARVSGHLRVPHPVLCMTRSARQRLEAWMERDRAELDRHGTRGWAAEQDDSP